MVSVCNAIMALSAETLIFLKRKIIMKKTFIIIAMAGILTAITGCGKTDSGITSDNNKTTTKTIVTTTAVTTAENTSTTSAKEDNNKTESSNTSTTAAKKSKDTAKTETSVNDAAISNSELKEEDRLFGAYVDTQGDGLNLRNEPFPTADIIATIPDKTQIDIYSCGKAGWYCTSYNGKSGYVSADYVKEIQDYEPQENTQKLITDISELVGQWKYQIAPEGMNITAGVTDNGTIDIKSDGTYTYTDLDGNNHSGTVKVDYDIFGGDYSVPFFAFYEGDQFFIGCYCHETHSDVYMTGNGGMSQIVRIK